MKREIVRCEPQDLHQSELLNLPTVVQDAGAGARFAYGEFFSGIDSPHTERAYRGAVHRFLAWCESRGIALSRVRPTDVSGYIKSLAKHNGEAVSKPTKKLHLAALKHFFDCLVLRHAIVLNPAASVRGPRHSVSEGKTAALSTNQARRLLAGIDTQDAIGLRDRAIIGVLVYTACRVGAVAKLRCRDYFTDGRQRCLRLDEKGGKSRDIPVRHDLEGFIDDYLQAAHDADRLSAAPLFLSAVRREKRLAAYHPADPSTGTAERGGMTSNDVLRMVKRRFRAAGLPAERLTCHSFRATTITNLLDQGVPLEDVQFLAGHADPRTTRLYDRRKRQVTRNIVERISI